MKRFILLSFVFLGLGFYELSGGAEFDPVAAREAAILARSDAPQTPGPSVKGSAAAVQLTEADLDNQVTRVSLNLVSFGDAAAPQAGVQRQTSEPAIAEPESSQVTPVTFSTGDETPAVLPSLIFPGSTSRASSDAVTLEQNLRFISGDRVNMRGGPGTGFDVVTQLVRGTQVEVLQDNGTGWVRLRPADGGPEGWIADFLLSGG
ncbi:hypothetical protein So717_27130 [Roseobacter cerasinus]|uniref:SH3b domain-containing protein n=1 Tax=Roseobacter cerasinus TaxID=2602289 RepID=A0A640VU79_9RHOB|nr:SH3 domain-containing protein [Roseobacter cerasinus]GFE50960.1 hypothetical protein So717_27130 [Roseobacter cerasinus]